MGLEVPGIVSEALLYSGATLLRYVFQEVKLMKFIQRRFSVLDFLNAGSAINGLVMGIHSGVNWFDDGGKSVAKCR